MSTPAYDLATKAGQALAKYIAACPLLQGVEVTVDTTDEPKENGSVVVTANRGDIVGGQGSGIWGLTVTVSLAMKRKRNVSTAKLFLKRSSILAGLLEVNPFELAKLVTAAYGGEFHCYFLQLTGDQKTPDGYTHSIEFSLNMEAMPVSRETGLLNAKDQG